MAATDHADALASFSNYRSSWVDLGAPGVSVLSLAPGGGYRYVVVSLAPARPESRAIAIIGHELRHAVEVAEHPEIVDVRSFSRAYQRFGFTSVGSRHSHTFDTQAAIDAGERVSREVSRRVGTLSEAATLLETRP